MSEKGENLGRLLGFVWLVLVVFIIGSHGMVLGICLLYVFWNAASWHYEWVFHAGFFMIVLTVYFIVAETLRALAWMRKQKHVDVEVV